MTLSRLKSSTSFLGALAKQRVTKPAWSSEGRLSCDKYVRKTNSTLTLPPRHPQKWKKQKKAWNTFMQTSKCIRSFSASSNLRTLHALTNPGQTTLQKGWQAMSKRPAGRILLVAVLGWNGKKTHQTLGGSPAGSSSSCLPRYVARHSIKILISFHVQDEEVWPTKRCQVRTAQTASAKRQGVDPSMVSFQGAQASEVPLKTQPLALTSAFVRVATRKNLSMGDLPKCFNKSWHTKCPKYPKADPSCLDEDGVF